MFSRFHDYCHIMASTFGAAFYWSKVQDWVDSLLLSLLQVLTIWSGLNVQRSTLVPLASSRRNSTIRISRSPLLADLLHVDVLPWVFFCQDPINYACKIDGALKPKFTLLDSITESSAFKHGVSFALLAMSLCWAHQWVQKIIATGGPMMWFSADEVTLATSYGPTEVVSAEIVDLGMMLVRLCRSGISHSDSSCNPHAGEGIYKHKPRPNGTLFHREAVRQRSTSRNRYQSKQFLVFKKSINQAMIGKMMLLQGPRYPHFHMMALGAIQQSWLPIA